ncbi:MAG: hypothetical protein QM734_17110 [Cyclobacteriaceae bacterium]
MAQFISSAQVMMKKINTSIVNTTIKTTRKNGEASISKIPKWKVQYVTSTSMNDFKAKLKAQPDGKKGDPYSGRKIKFTEAVISPNNEVILAGQNFGFEKNGKGQIIGRAYEDLVMFHFDANGNLISQYTMNKKKKAMSPDGQYFEFSSDGKTLYWTYFDVIDTKAVKELNVTVDKPLGVPKWVRSILLQVRSTNTASMVKMKILFTMVAFLTT